MSTAQSLRALVNERLAAAADEIFALFERTIAEYEEELCLYKEENQRKQDLLDSVLSPKVVLFRATDVQIPSWNPVQRLNQEITSPMIKDEPEDLSIKHEENELPELVPESNNVCVKGEESLLQQNDERMGEEDTLETCLHPEEDKGHTSDHDEDCGAPFSWSDIEKETEEAELAYGDHCYQIRDKSSAEPNFGLYSEIYGSVNVEDAQPGTAERAGKNKYQCFVCEKKFKTKQQVKVHERIHTGEKPFSCPFCEKTFSQNEHLKTHLRIHTGDKPFSCPTCNKAFAHKGNLRVHNRLHTGERPYGCSVCTKEFPDSSSRNKHMKTHTRKAMRLNRLSELV